MSVFSSNRERRLWRWSLLTVLGIYATLPFASSFATYLYNQGLAAVVFLTCLLLIGITILIQGLRTRPSGLEIGVGIGVATVFVLVLFRLSLPERSHIIEYGVVATLVYEALMERTIQGRYVPLPAVFAITLTSTAGAIDELVQFSLPNRHFEWTDILFNFLAAFMAVVAISILRWTRNSVEKRLAQRATTESES